MMSEERCQDVDVLTIKIAENRTDACRFLSRMVKFDEKQLKNTGFDNFAEGARWVIENCEKQNEKLLAAHERKWPDF